MRNAVLEFSKRNALVASFARVLGSRKAREPDIFARPDPVFKAQIQQSGGGVPIHTSQQLAEVIRSSLQTPAGMVVNDATSMQVAAVFACVRLLSESIAMLPLRLYSADGDVETLAPKHPVDSLLYVAPNSWQTPFEYWRLVAGHVLLRGNAYSYKAKNTRGETTALIPLNPSKMTPTLSPEFKLQYSYIRPDGNPIVYSQDDIFHVRGLAMDGVVGLGPLQAARNAIGLALVTEDQGSKLFSQGVRPSGVLKTEKALSDSAYTHLKDSFEDTYSGNANAHRMMLLEEGLEWQQIGMTAEDSQFLETRKFQRNEIAMFFNVPPHMIGDVDKATSWGSGIEQQNLGFLIYTLNSWLRNVAQSVRRDLLNQQDRVNYVAKHDTSELTRADFLTRQQGLTIMRSAGVLSANEWRRVEHMNPIKDGDTYEKAAAPSNGTQGTQQNAPQDPSAGKQTPAKNLQLLAGSVR